MDIFLLLRKANIIVEYIDYITGEKLSEKDENGEEIDSTIMGEGHESDEYTLELKLTKKTDEEWELKALTNEDIKKIQGMY